MTERTVLSELEKHKGEMVRPVDGGLYLVDDLIPDLQAGKVAVHLVPTVQTEPNHALRPDDMGAEVVEDETGSLYVRINAEKPLYAFPFRFFQERAAGS